MQIFLFIFIFTLAISASLEKYVVPEHTYLDLPKIILNSAIIGLIFLTLTLIVQRPIFASLTVLIFQIIVLAVNRAKFIALKEPLVFSDFAMFSQAFKHPRLYFPFLGMAPVIIAPIIIIVLIIAVLWLEPAYPFSMVRVLPSVIVIIALFFFAIYKAEALPLSRNPATDNERHGLINTLFAYTVQALSPNHKQQVRKILKTSPFAVYSTNKSNIEAPPHFREVHTNIDQPNITVIQSESFFDARRLHPNINADILQNFDAIKAESQQSGKLSIPAWGANTMRSEFAFLTGLEYKDMGLFRYYPYQFIRQMPISSIASALQAQGYYCVCIHPHPASFFGRDQVFPKMGFDEFIDVGSFEGAEKFGPYISDQAVTEKVLEISQQMSHKPLFIFVITMENHGPLHLEKTSSAEHTTYYSQPIPNITHKKLNDLTVYLRHLKNADSMIKTLTDYYKQSQQATTLCFYGDHVPSMPNIYQALNYTDNHSDYFIWNSSTEKSNTNTSNNMYIENLAEKLILL